MWLIKPVQQIKKRMKAIACVIGILTLWVFTIFTPSWNIDPNYSIKFSGSKAEGSFTGLTGTIEFDKNQLGNAKMDVSVNATTINTGNSLKDKHARGESWFDVTKYPTIKFTSSQFERRAAQFSVMGILELHGIKKAVTIPFDYIENGRKSVFNGSFKVNRKDYDINGNIMGFMVGDTFIVTLNIPASK